MPLPAKKIYNFCQQSWAEAETAIVNLYASREKIIKAWPRAKENFFVYFFPIYELLSAPAKDSLWPHKQSLIKMVDANLINDFIFNPQNIDARDGLSEQIAILYAALGFYLPFDIYSRKEIEQVVSGSLEYYDDTAFARTLNAVLSSSLVPMDYTDSLKGLLRPEGGKEMQGLLEWHDAFLFALLLHALWKQFFFLSKDTGEMLLKNYFYFALAVGVPIRDILVQFLNDHLWEGREESEKWIFNCLQSNQESIPLNTACTEWKKMIDVVKNYSIRLQGRQSSGFDQEEFVKGFYEGQEGRDAFRGWLRELLNIMFHLYE